MGESIAEGSRPSGPPRAAVWVAPALAAVLAYLPNLDDYFVSDDFDHPFVLGYSWEALWAHLSRPAAAGDFFRPLTRASMWLDHALWGATPEPSHAVNVLLHAATASLVGALGHRLSGRASVGLLAGALFAVHPIHPEAVSFLGGRFDVLSGLFAAGSLLAYTRFSEAGSRRWLAASTACFAASILSKEAGLFVPFALLGYELLLARPRRLWGPVASFATLALYGAHRAFVIGAAGGYQTELGESRHLPTLTPWYLEELLGFVGYGLVTPVSPPALEGLALPLAVALGALFAAAALTAAALRTARGRALAFCLAATVVAALPASTLYSVHGLLSGLEGARFLYVPSITFCVMLALLLDGVRPRGLRAAAIALQIGLYGLLVVAHARVWSHASELSRRVVEAAQRDCGDLSGPEPTVIVYDAPDNHQGAFVLRNGIPMAMERLHPARPVGRFFRAEMEQDFVDGDAFDVRDLVGRSDVCALLWDRDRGRAIEVSEALRSAPPRVSFDDPRANAGGERWWRDWALSEATPQSVEGGVWTFEATGEDPQLESVVPLGARELRFTMTVTPTGDAPAPLGEVFWAVDDVPFATARAHHRLFEVRADGEPHVYRLPIPLGDPRELRGERLRLRLDPTTFPAIVSIGPIELLVRPFGAPAVE